MRKLTKDEIECRVATVSEKGCSLLLYKDARVDMRMLDEEFGANNWQREHEEIDGKLFCTISVWDADKGTWVKKQDVGVESYTEKEKGQASDSFKRAGFNWGIGRELYTAPWIWINKGDVTLKEKNGKITTYDKFIVRQIEYDGDKISKLEIYNQDLHKVVFTLGKLGEQQKADDIKPEEPTYTPTENDEDSAVTTEQLEQIEKLCKRDKVAPQYIAKMHPHKTSLDELTRKQAYNVVLHWSTVVEKFNETQGIPFK